MKRILVVAPHADDEVLGAGGTIAKNVAEGNEAYICVVTRGAEPLFSKTLTEQVREETIKAHKLLGIKETYFLEYPAVMLENIERYKLNESILQVVQKIKPDEVYIPHMGDMQKDHQIVNEAVVVAVRPKYNHKVHAVYAYETLSETEWNIPNTVNAFIPTVYEDISGFLDKKKQALACFETQISDFPDPRSLEAVDSLAKYRGSTVEVPAAEAFVLIREIR